MEKGYGAHDDDAMEHARFHGSAIGRSDAQDWAAAFLAGTATVDDLPEPDLTRVVILAPDGTDLADHVARASSPEDAENGAIDIPECYGDAYNESVRAVALEHGITLPPGTAPCVGWHELVGPDLETETVTCERCGYTEDADPDDVAEQVRLLAEIDAGGE